MYCTCHFEIVDYSFNEFVIIYSLHFVCHYLFGGIYKIKKKKTRYWIYKSKDSIRKINNSLKILGINQTLLSHILMNLIRFPVKLNIEIITYLSI